MSAPGDPASDRLPDRTDRSLDAEHARPSTAGAEARSRPRTSASAIIGAVVLGAVLLAGGFVLGFHREWLTKGPGADDEASKVETDVPVHVAKVKRATLHRFVDGFGLVRAEPAHDGQPAASAHLASPVAGVLTDSFCVEGQRVEKGATLFQLDTRVATAEEGKAIATKSLAEATEGRLREVLAFAEGENERTVKLEQSGLASAKDLHESELAVSNAKNQLLEAEAQEAEAKRGLIAASVGRSILDIKAPISGTIVRIFVNPGEGVDTNPVTVIADLVDLDRLVVEARLPAIELPSLALDEAVELRLATSDSGPTQAAASLAPVKGTISFLGYEVDTKTDTIGVRIRFPSTAGFRPGQHLALRVAVATDENKLAVPVESVVSVDGKSVVAIVDGDRAVQKPVVVGIREGGLVEVTGDGITEGATVVTAGAYGLPNETRVRVTSE